MAPLIPPPLLLSTSRQSSLLSSTSLSIYSLSCLFITATSGTHFFSTTSHQQRTSRDNLRNMMAKIPPYNHPIPQTFKRQWFGLFGGKTLQFGNSIPESERTPTRRRWYPNILNKGLWSNALNRMIKIKVSASVMRTIDRCGGLDEYLLGEKQQRLKELGPAGWKLRWLVMNTDWGRNRFKKQREEFGLDLLVAERGEGVSNYVKNYGYDLEVKGDAFATPPEYWMIRRYNVKAVKPQPRKIRAEVFEENQEVEGMSAEDGDEGEQATTEEEEDHEMLDFTEPAEELKGSEIKRV